jgi:hypothetical protein
VSSEAPKDADAYLTLVQIDQMRGGLIAKSCKLKMASITHSICATMNEKNFDQLSQSCPAEAKKIMEAKRKREQSQAGRSFSGRSFSSASASSKPASNSGSSNPTNQLLDSAKKLKGLFGF